MIAVEELSKRELQVLQFLADGSKLREVAKRLRLAEDTVKHHTTNIREKLNTPTTSNAVATALRRGLID